MKEKTETTTKKKNRCKICELLGDKHEICQLESLHHQLAGHFADYQQQHSLLSGLYLQQLKDMMLAAYLLKGYYQPAGPLIQHPPLPSVKGPPPDPTPTPPQNSEGSDDLVATSTTSGGTSSTGGGFYRTYCPQYYPTPPQYQELCYPPSYSHSHPHPPPYYHKYGPPYRSRQYYGYQETGAGGPGGSGAGPGVVEYQPPPGEYLPPYYGGYAPPPAPLPPPPNPAYLHSQGRPFVDHAFQSCPCPMQTCPKNADTGPLIGNGKGAPVVTGPGLSLPPSALVGPPSPARGLAGLAPPHGANAWDTDRVQLNPAHRSHQQQQQQNQNQPQGQQQGQQQDEQAQRSKLQRKQQSAYGSSSSTSASSAEVGARVQQAGCAHASDCITKGDTDCTEGLGKKCTCEKQRSTTAACGSVKLEQSISPTSSDDTGTTTTTTDKHQQHRHRLKLENNNVKCEACSGDEGVVASQHATNVAETAATASEEDEQQDHREQHGPSCRVKCEAGYKCEILKCEQCVKEAGQLAIMEMDKDSGILEDDAGSGKLENDSEVKEELNGLADTAQWKKPDYEPTAPEPVVEEDEAHDDETHVDEDDASDSSKSTESDETTQQPEQQSQQQQPKCQKVGKRKLSLDSLSSDVARLKKVNKRTLSVGSPRELATVNGEKNERLVDAEDAVDSNATVKESSNPTKKKATKKETQSQKRKSETPSSSETPPKKTKGGSTKTIATETSIMETINNVIQQSLQMSQKPAKTKKSKTNSAAAKVEKKNKKNSSVNLLSTIKRASKKLDLVKAVVSEKIGMIKNEIKNSQQKINNKMDTKLKTKVKAKNGKVKTKLLEAKSKVLETKNNNNNKLPEVKNNKVPETKNNNKIVETKNNKVLETKTTKVPDVKVSEIKNTKFAEPKNKVQGKKHQEAKEHKDAKESKEIKSAVVTPVKEAKPAKTKDSAKKGKVAAQETTKCKKKGKGAKKAAGRRESIASKFEEQCREAASKCLTMSRRPFLKPKWSNGWSWEGDAFEAKVYLTNEESAIRRCYVSMRHESGDVLRPLDCVLLKSGPRKADLPFVAKIAALWENPDDGEMMFSLLWYYRPEHTEQGRTEYDTDDEVFASRHRDANSVACIEDKCYILTFNEYCRYRKNLRRIEEGLENPSLIVPPGDQMYPREARQPPIPVPQDMVLFCRRVYDYRGKKLVKNPG